MNSDLNTYIQNPIGGVSKKAITSVSSNNSSHPNSLSQGKKSLTNSRDNPFKYGFLAADKTDKELDAAVANFINSKVVGAFDRAVSFASSRHGSNSLTVDSLSSLSQNLKQILDDALKSRLDELKDILKDTGFSDEDINLLKNVLENPDFQRLIENNPGLAREMLESIKSDPFNDTEKVTFKKDNYELFAKLERTGIDSIIKGGLGDSLYNSLESFANQNDFNSQLYKSFLDQALASPEVQKILSDDSLNDREKLQGVIQNTSNFIKSGMENFGVLETNEKLVSPGEPRLIVFGDTNARNEFFKEGGAYDQAKAQNPNLQIAFMELGSGNNNALAQSLGIDTNSISKGDFNAAFITQQGYNPNNPGQFKLNSANLQESLKKYSEDQNSKTSLSSELTKDWNTLKNNEVKALNINSSDSKDNDVFADLYAKIVLKEVLAGKDTSLKDGLDLGKGTLAGIAAAAAKIFDTAKKSGLSLNANDVTQVLGKFSGLDQSKIAQLKADLGGKYDARTLGVLLQAGKTSSADLNDNDHHLLKLFSKYQGIAGKNNEALYKKDMKDLFDRDILVNYLYDKMPGSDITYKEAAEKIMNIPSDTRGFFDGATALNAIASVNTIAQILKDPLNAFKNGEGFYARLTIADAKDHIGAFGLNTGNRYVRGNEEATMSLLSQGKLGNVTIYGGNGMTDDEFEKRLKRLLHTGTQLSGSKGELLAVADNSTVRGLGLKHVSEEGHGNTSGNHGVAGSLDSSDKHRFKTYASLVKGDSFTLNCVACSNMGGGNSYGHVVLNEMAKHLGKNVRLYATGAEVPTPPQRDRVAHFKGHIAPGLMTNSDRIIFMQGLKEVSDTDMIKLSNTYRDEYNITRVTDDSKLELSSLNIQNQNIFISDPSKLTVTNTKTRTKTYVNFSFGGNEEFNSKSEWLEKTNSKAA